MTICCAGPAGDGPPDGSIPAGGPTGSDGGGASPAARPELAGRRRRPRGIGFDPTARFVEQLGLDDTDPATAAALEVCTPLLTEAFTATNESTDTTEAG